MPIGAGAGGTGIGPSARSAGGLVVAGTAVPSVASVRASTLRVVARATFFAAASFLRGAG